MKNLFKTGFLSLMALLAFGACSDDDDAVNLAKLSVEVASPEGFGAAFSGEVVITSKALGKSYTATAEKGVALFEAIYPGNYDLTAHDVMTREEAQAAAPDKTFNSGILINGVKGGIAVELNKENRVSVNTSWSVESKIVLGRVYINGTRLNNGKRKNGHIYYEFFNNSSEVEYLDGLCMGQVHGNTSGKAQCMLYEKYQKEAAYVSRIVRFPGEHGKTKDIPVEPGKSLVLAFNAQNFIVTDDTDEKCTMTVDLTGADYEMASTGADWIGYVDNVNVPDIKYVYDCMQPQTSGFLNIKQCLVLFYATEAEVEGWETGTDESMFGNQAQWKAKRVPNDIIIDAFQNYGDGANMQKNVPDVLDAKGIVSKTNEGLIFARKIQYKVGERIVLQDTNNSYDDFVVIGSADRENYDGAHLVIRDYSHPSIQPAL